MCFLIKNFKDDKIPDLYDRFFVSNWNLTTEHIKIVKNSRFFSNFSNSSFFLPKLFNSTFLRFTGKVATLSV